MWYFYFGLLFAGFAQTTDGAFYFTREPAKEVYFLKGSDASFQWNYTVEDRAAEFQFIIWKAQNVTTRTFYPLINEKENFDVAVSSRIPLAYVGRVEKKGEATLVIKSVNFEDSTTYRCLLQAKDTRSNQSDVQLHVTGSVSASPKVQCAEEGGSATFTCTARAVPSQNFTWLQQEGTQRIVDGERYSIVSSSGLSRFIIKNVSAADHGFYVCDATMNLKQPNKAVFYLQVPCVDPPKEDRTFCRETSYSLALGDDQIICCPVSGYPPPFITWSKNGARVNNENSVLKIYSLMDEDYGNYTCTATDFRTSFGPINITIIKKAGLSLDVIDGTAEKPAKLEIQRLPEAKVYVVKISGQVIHDDYLVGAKTSLEFHYHSLVMKTGSERPEQVKIQVEVSAMNDKGYKLVEASTRELIVKRPSDTEY